MASKQTAIPLSIPEPPPVRKGVCVLPIALELATIVQTSTSLDEMKTNVQRAIPALPLLSVEKKEEKKTEHKLAELLQARANFGLQKYGQPLMSQDGRNDVEDLKQELGDAFMYLTKAIINGQDLSSIHDSITALSTLYHIASNK
jgi:hypothetical protein